MFPQRPLSHRPAPVVSYLADEIAAIHHGRLMESGPKAAVLEPPFHPYTKVLLSAIPRPDPRLRREPIRLHGDNGSEPTVAGGCPFHARCPRFLGEVCRTEEPPLAGGARRQTEIYCHIPIEQLERAQEPAWSKSGESTGQGDG